MPSCLAPLSRPARLPSGSLALDWALGGGYPRGRITHIVGEPSYGKSTLMSIAAARTIKDNGYVGLFDTEQSYDPFWAERLGVDHNRLAMLAFNSGEDALNKIIALVKANVFDLIIFDSIAETLFNAEAEAEVGGSLVGVHARIWNQFYRKIKTPLAQSKTALVMINQIRHSMVTMGNPETEPGGRGQHFAASIKIRMSKPERTPADTKKPAEAIVFRPNVKKNKTAPAGREARVVLNMTPDFFGVSDIADLLDVGKTLYVFTKEDGSAINGNCYWFYGEQKLGLGAKGAGEAILADDELMAKIERDIRTAMEVTI